MPTIKINGIQLHYEIAGDGEPLLFLHGLGSSTRDWHNQIEHFSDQYRVIVVDMRGHGQSAKPRGPYSVSQFADDVAAFLGALETGPVHLVGLSMGGMIAFQLAVDEPTLLHSMVIVNSGPALILSTLRQKLYFKQRIWTVRLLGMRKMGQVLADDLLPEPHQRALHDKFVERWAQNDRKGYLASLRAIIGWSVADRIHTIRCPVLAVSADQDYTPVSVKQAYAAQMPNAAVTVVPDSRHMTPIDQPAIFNRALADFLAGNPL